MLYMETMAAECPFYACFSQVERLVGVCPNVAWQLHWRAGMCGSHQWKQ